MVKYSTNNMCVPEVINIPDKNQIKIIVGLFAGAILFNWALQNLGLICGFAGGLLSLVYPLILGVCVAFILNMPMRALEKWLFADSQLPLKRPASLLLTILLMLALVFIVLIIVIPEVVRAIETLVIGFPGFIDRATVWGQELFVKYPNLGVWLSGMGLDWDNAERSALSLLKSGAANIMNSIFGISTSLFSGLFNFFLGLIFAVYILSQKENLKRQGHSLLNAYIPKSTGERIIYIGSLANKTFTNFITGQCTEAVILGLMVFAAMTIFRFPYALVISVLVTCTALIPIFGAFIACFIGAFLILVTSPIQALWFVLLFIVIQQIEGNFIYPRVVGNSVGLPALWVLAAVTIGGGAMGIIGMLVSVPVFAVLYVLLRESVKHRVISHGTVPTDTSD